MSNIFFAVLLIACNNHFESIRLLRDSDQANSISESAFPSLNFTTEYKGPLQELMLTNNQSTDLLESIQVKNINEFLGSLFEIHYENGNPPIFSVSK